MSSWESLPEATKKLYQETRGKVGSQALTTQIINNAIARDNKGQLKVRTQESTWMREQVSHLQTKYKDEWQDGGDRGGGAAEVWKPGIAQEGNRREEGEGLCVYASYIYIYIYIYIKYIYYV